jgi:hypothetical protein
VLARVTRFEGGDADAMRSSAAEIQQQGNEAGGPPEGLPAKALLMLQDPAGGKSLAISFFENEADYEQGDRVLNEMSPPGGGMGQRVGVDKYEVAVEFRSDSLGGADAAAT